MGESAQRRGNYIHSWLFPRTWSNFLLFRCYVNCLSSFLVRSKNKTLLYILLYPWWWQSLSVTYLNAATCWLGSFSPRPVSCVRWVQAYHHSWSWYVHWSGNKICAWHLEPSWFKVSFNVSGWLFNLIPHDIFRARKTFLAKLNKMDEIYKLETICVLTKPNKTINPIL